MTGWTFTGPCGARVHWWDCDLDAYCLIGSPGHAGPHTDGLRWFTDEGLQVPTEARPYVRRRARHPRGCGCRRHASQRAYDARRRARKEAGR